MTVKTEWYGQKVKDEINNRALTAVKKCCIKVETDAKKMAPVQYGRLRASITHNYTGSGIQRSNVDNSTTGTQQNDGIGNPGGDKENIKGVVGTNVHYGPHQEFGTRHMPAHPYLRPALHQNEQYIRNSMNQANKDK